ncbi:MAG TPA: glycoside hydrolase family 47 protein, partial [Thermoanaerobaculia bacterium]|nr:glycoside hydrolase family 47 protein [Thermoanaerobaculia bacterium]
MKTTLIAAALALAAAVLPAAGPAPAAGDASPAAGPAPAASPAPAAGSPAPPLAPLPLDRAALAARVRAEMLRAWQGYERYAWGHDELRPVSKTARDWYAAPLLMTPVDALDTLLLMGLDDEAAKARELIVTRLSFDQDLSVKNFEITIRMLGGLLSSWQMTGDPRLLRLAEDLGTRLLPAFNSPTGMPYTFVNLRTGATRGPRSNPAEIGTLLLEFGTLARATGRRTASEVGALHAFFPAVLALGGDLERARRLEASCFKMWNLHGIEPETVDYRSMRVVEAGYPLRPEIVESAYYLRHYTNDPRYLEMGRTFFSGLLA